VLFWGGIVKLTFVTWNLLRGGVDAGSNARLRRQLAVVSGVRPAVAALQECRYWDQEYFRTFYLAEQLLQMRGFLSLSAHHGCHLAVFIREEAGLRVTEQRHEQGYPYWHGAARIVVEAQGFPQPLQLASVQLAPSSPAIRLAEAEAFTMIVKAGPVIAGGDWNALPAGDPEPPGSVEGRSRRKADRRPAGVLQEAGFVDAGALLGDLTPTVGHKSELAYRCDRVHTTLPAQTVTGYEVITTADAESDHRMVAAEFDLSRAAGLHAGRAGGDDDR
jgi:endonuclease/exonuclease/phosphatase family metal-dependent hydrolase